MLDFENIGILDTIFVYLFKQFILEIILVFVNF